MKQYHDLARRILDEGIHKSSGRKGMPDTISVFGHQLRINLQDGFPLLTTKKVSFKNILVELLWFLRGSTNIKFLVDNGCNIWNKDAYRWYKTKHKELLGTDGSLSYDQFIDYIKKGDFEATGLAEYGYKLGDLGNVYGAQWRNWEKPINVLERLTDLLSDTKNGRRYDFQGNLDLREAETKEDMETLIKDFITNMKLTREVSKVDQIANVIDGIKKNPFGRRHIVSAWNPTDLENMALPPCHLLFHFNCRPATMRERTDWVWDNDKKLKEEYSSIEPKKDDEWQEWFDSKGVPDIVLDCLMYQRSCDSFLGVPYNLASYALLTEIIAKITGRIAGEFIWTGGDTHFYENHLEAIKTQLERNPKNLPTLRISDRVSGLDDPKDINLEDFEIMGYDPDPAIKAKLSVGEE